MFMNEATVKGVVLRKQIKLIGWPNKALYESTDLIYRK